MCLSICGRASLSSRGQPSALEGMNLSSCFTTTAFSVEMFCNAPKAQAHEFAHFAFRAGAAFLFFCQLCR